MAVMIPSIPYGFDPRSREDEIFHSLEKLPDDYYVFYSLKLSDFENRLWHEKEIDFVVYNRRRGVMFIEAKAGHVWCDKGIWKYASGNEMKDPFKQADDGRYGFVSLLKKKYKGNQYAMAILEKCPFCYAVWFPSVSRKNLQDIVFPTNAPKELVMTAEDMENPLSSIEKIFSYKYIERKNAGIGRIELTDDEHAFLMNQVLCPEFHILPSKSFELDYKRKRFDAMIAEQMNLLNYLDYQNTATISGAAGTGKTMIAVEKARRHSVAGESVLFLCFNIKLKEFLEKAYPYPNVKYLTIDGFACLLCASSTPDYYYLQNELAQYLDKPEEFPYQHVIIDEGQDFGQTRMHTDSIFKLLEDIALDKDGTFYVFYDKYQMIQSREIPAFIENADCRLTLYKNCRNTQRIADTSIRPLKLEKAPKVIEGAVLGTNPVIYFCERDEVREKLDLIIKESIENGIDNIQILSCKPADESCMDSWVKNETYSYGEKTMGFTTVRKFKGLEADHIVLVDIDRTSITDNSMLFYVGASRAKIHLSIIANISSYDCEEIIHAFGSMVKRNKPQESLAKLLGCSCIK